MRMRTGMELRNNSRQNLTSSNYPNGAFDFSQMTKQERIVAARRWPLVMNKTTRDELRKECALAADASVDYETHRQRWCVFKLDGLWVHNP